MSTSPGGATPTTLRIIWFAFLAAPLVYGVIGWLVTAERDAVPVSMALGAAFVLAVVATAIAGFVVPDLVAGRRRAVASRADTPLGIYQTAMIVRWACFEAVAIYGFVFAIVSGRFLVALAGSVLAVALIASAPPRPDSVEE